MQLRISLLIDPPSSMTIAYSSVSISIVSGRRLVASAAEPAAVAPHDGLSVVQDAHSIVIASPATTTKPRRIV